jgi:hypothetical protein
VAPTKAKGRKISLFGKPPRESLKTEAVSAVSYRTLLNYLVIIVVVMCGENDIEELRS